MDSIIPTMSNQTLPELSLPSSSGTEGLRITLMSSSNSPAPSKTSTGLYFLTSNQPAATVTSSAHTASTAVMMTPSSTHHRYETLTTSSTSIEKILTLP